MKKKCLGCARTFGLSGSGRPQKYCPKCVKRAIGKGMGIIGLQPIDNKGSVRQQILDHGSSPNPASFTTPDACKGRVWLASNDDGPIVGGDLHWRVHIAEAINRLPKPRAASKFAKPVDLMNGRLRGHVEQRSSIFDAELAAPLKDFTVRLLFEDEAPQIGSGYRTVLCQFRGKKVLLHYAQPVTLLDSPEPITQTIKLELFKELVASTKQRRNRNPVPALERATVTEPQQLVSHSPEPFAPNYAEVLKGNDYPLQYHEDGYPRLPSCLDRRKPKLELVVNNPVPRPETEAA
jgi:hypothetical protein